MTMSKESLEKREFAEEIIEKEVAKKEEKKEVENPIANHNYIISQNRVIFVNKITNKDIKSGGKYATGENYMTGESVQILDKDYGKSAELMRALLETENATPLWKKALILLILGGVILGVGAVLFTAIPSGKEEPIQTPVNNVGVETTNPIIGGGNTENKVIVKGIDVEETPVFMEDKEEGQPIKEFTTSDNIEVMQVSNEIETLRHNYEIEKLQIELQKLMEEKNEEVHKNFELLSKIEQKDILISELEQKVKIYEEKPKNLNEEAFLLHLGNVVYKKCEKSIEKGEKNACKEIYYNFLKDNENDTGNIK